MPSPSYDDRLIAMFDSYCKYGNILATENQQAIINDVIDIKTGVYLYKT